MQVKLGKIAEGTGKPEAQKVVDSESELCCNSLLWGCSQKHRSAGEERSSRSRASCHLMERRRKAPDLWDDWKSGVFPR